MTKTPSRILGVSEGIETVDGTGSKPHTSQMEKSLWPGISTQQFLSVHS